MCSFKRLFLLQLPSTKFSSWCQNKWGHYKTKQFGYWFCFWNRVSKFPRLILNLPHSWGWPWTCNLSASTSEFWGYKYKPPHKTFNFFNLCVCLYGLHICMHCWQRQEGHVWSYETGVTHNCESPCLCWKLNSDPLEVQPALLTTVTSLQPSHLVLGSAKNQTQGFVYARQAPYQLSYI